MNMNPLSISSARFASADSQPLTLREGQMIHGRVQQLFPGQMAQVQVGSQQLYAKLEVPMQAGDTYYFKVNGTEPEVQLQVIAGPMRGSEGQTGQLAQLTESLNLPKTAEMKELLAAVIKQKFPMTRENLLDAANLLKNVPDGMKGQALATLGKMANMRLPFTPAVFQSLMQAQTGTITQSLTSLQSALQNEQNLAPALREQILNALQALANPASQTVGKEILGQTITQLLNPQTNNGDRFAALQLLKTAGILPAQTSLANLPQAVALLMTQSSESKALVPQQPQFSTNQAAGSVAASGKVNGSVQVKADGTAPSTSSSAASQTDRRVKVDSQTAPLKAVQALLGQLNQTPAAEQQTAKTIIQNLAQLINANPNLPESAKVALQTVINQISQQPEMTDSAKAAFIEQFSQTLLQQVSALASGNSAPQQMAPRDAQQALMAIVSIPPEQADETLRMLIQNAEKSGNTPLKQLVQTAEMQVSQAMNGTVMKEAMRSALCTLGINYEALLNGKEPNLANLANTLKPQLLTLLQDPYLSPPLREAAETMLLRMNGTIIQTAETSVQQQLIMQMPLELFGKKIDATLQWNGRMKENGKIDPAFARIVFYLELEALSTTLVDMHVQNKVVNLTIFNEQESLRTTGLTFQSMLKDGLEQVGYKLSGVSFKPFTETPQPVKKPAVSLYTDEGGVDYRI
ncbi:hypothetical protein HMPREF9372_0660 [Sporosarcina newyorkensis 2681]|uniref:Flagellar hook-length control protein-like C-terminal domain-containing protein n=1 Tax=Sporosarcina newyorkensis 2681 TaxID=1027292 RepID=F9DPD0_9BACL|nr:hypothetical protein [Sporosarcina newyorkensis]EGQ27326.1 hypothetical protein HMPREF9372_0660 [Sporosarcina newyorkensis 2681]